MIDITFSYSHFKSFYYLYSKLPTQRKNDEIQYHPPTKGKKKKNKKGNFWFGHDYIDFNII